MYAKYIKKEYPDLNGTGQTQAYYKMQTTAMDYEAFVELCCREGAMPKDAIKGVLTLVSEKLALCMAEGRAVKIDGKVVANGNGYSKKESQQRAAKAAINFVKKHYECPKKSSINSQIGQ